MTKTGTILLHLAIDEVVYDTYLSASYCSKSSDVVAVSLAGHGWNVQAVSYAVACHWVCPLTWQVVERKLNMAMTA